MTDGLKERLDALRQLAPRLNGAADEVNAVVKAVEKALAEEIELGVAATSSSFRCMPRRRGDEDEEVEWYLAFGRIGDAYGIHVLEQTCREWDQPGWCADPVDERRIPWSACDRQARLEAFEKLPELLDNLARAVEEKLAVAERTAALVRELTGASE
jgi:hypothetical protein